ncbi:MAG: hypothetical protein KJ958_11185 [Gammaproteobacteria bacterium]|nr:hypothetical protein [Gammaproteobacteria bacterium]MBU1979717.1 hypothetical protein [Gammaproteobacteria bacterium]
MERRTKKDGAFARGNSESLRAIAGIGYETAEERRLSLERGEPNRLSRQRPARFWQAVAALPLIVNLLLWYVVIVG